VRRRAARHARRVGCRPDIDLTDEAADLRERDAARRQEAHAPVETRHDRGFESDRALAAVEHQLDRRAELFAHVLGARGTQASVAIGRRCRDTAAKSGEQLLRHWMRRDADGDCALATGHDVVNVRPARHDERQRPRPEALRKLLRGRRNFTHPAMQIARTVDVHDDRMTRGTPLDLENLAHGRRVRSVRAQAVDRLGGKGDELAGAQ